jgi:hypothetical protein
VKNPFLGERDYVSNVRAPTCLANPILAKVVTGPAVRHGKGDGLDLSDGNCFSASTPIGSIPPFVTWSLPLV